MSSFSLIVHGVSGQDTHLAVGNKDLEIRREVWWRVFGNQSLRGVKTEQCLSQSTWYQLLFSNIKKGEAVCPPCVRVKGPAHSSLFSSPSTQSHFLTVPLLLGLYSFLSFKLHKIYVTFTPLILSVQFSGLKYIHVVVQLSPPSISRTLSPSQTETRYPLNPNSPSPSPRPWQRWLYCPWIWLL